MEVSNLSVNFKKVNYWLRILSALYFYLILCVAAISYVVYKGEFSLAPSLSEAMTWCDQNPTVFRLESIYFHPTCNLLIALPAA